MAGNDGTAARKSAELVASWDRFCERERGFYPPKLAGFILGMTTQGLYSAGDRGVLRFHKVLVSRFYSAADVILERERRIKKHIDAAVTPLDRHLQAVAGHQARLPELPSLPSFLGDWRLFLDQHGGAFPSGVACHRLRMRPQGVWLAHKAGWIRSFVVGRENFFSRRDLEDYWFSVCRKNKGNRPSPRFRETSVCGKC